MNPRQVNRWRGIVQSVLRAVAAFAIAYGAYHLVIRMLAGALLGLRISQSFALGAAMVVIGSLLVPLARPLARWIVVVPPQTCPRCGYAQLPAPGERCPECGLRHP